MVVACQEEWCDVRAYVYTLPSVATTDGGKARAVPAHCLLCVVLVLFFHSSLK